MKAGIKLVVLFYLAVVTCSSRSFPCISIGEDVSWDGNPSAVSVCGDGVVTVTVGATIPVVLMTDLHGKPVVIKRVRVIGK